MGEKCLGQEHNAVPQPGLEPGLLDPEPSAPTIRPPHLPEDKKKIEVCTQAKWPIRAGA